MQQTFGRATAALRGKEINQRMLETWLTRSKPSGFADSADVVLVLTDDGNKDLPAHSAILAANSQVLCDMFSSTDCKPDAHGDAKKVKWRVPVPNATLKQATSFLEYVYCFGEIGLAVDAADSMTELLYRFDCTPALERVDLYLASETRKLEVNPRLHAKSNGRVCLPCAGKHHHYMFAVLGRSCMHRGHTAIHQATHNKHWTGLWYLRIATCQKLLQPVNITLASTSSACRMQTGKASAMQRAYASAGL